MAYRGTCVDGVKTILVDDKELMTCDLVEGLPESFGWGGESPGASAQTALAIMVHYFSDIEKALSYFAHFNCDVISQLDPNEPWEMTNDEIVDALCLAIAISSQHQSISSDCYSALNSSC